MHLSSRACLFVYRIACAFGLLFSIVCLLVKLYILFYCTTILMVNKDVVHEENTRPSSESSNFGSPPLWLDGMSATFGVIFCVRYSISLSWASSFICRLLLFCISSLNIACTSLCHCWTSADNLIAFSRSYVPQTSVITQVIQTGTRSYVPQTSVIT